MVRRRTPQFASRFRQFFDHMTLGHLRRGEGGRAKAVTRRSESQAARQYSTNLSTDCGPHRELGDCRATELKLNSKSTRLPFPLPSLIWKTMNTDPELAL
jgi:hypothetical protein